MIPVCVGKERGREGSETAAEKSRPDVWVFSFSGLGIVTSQPKWSGRAKIPTLPLLDNKIASLRLAG